MESMSTAGPQETQPDENEQKVTESTKLIEPEVEEKKISTEPEVDESKLRRVSISTNSLLFNAN